MIQRIRQRRAFALRFLFAPEKSASMLPNIAAGQGTPEPEQNLYTKPGGARSGGFAAGTLRGIRPAAFRLCRNRAPRGAYTLKSLLSEAAKGIQPHSANCFFIPAVPAAGALQTETAAENPRLPRKKPPTKMAVSLLAPPSIRPAGIQKSLPPQWNP